MAFADAPVAVADEVLSVLRLSGTPYQMGREHGQQKKTMIRRMVRRFADLADGDLARVPVAGALADGLEQHFTRDELDELRGMADVVGVPLHNLLALNLARCRPGLRGPACDSRCERSRAGLIHASSQELPLMSAWLSFWNRKLSCAHLARPCSCHAVVCRSRRGSVRHERPRCRRDDRHAVDRSGRAISRPCCCPDSGPSARGWHDIDSAVNTLKSLCSPQSWNACLSHGASERLCYVECDGAAVQMRDGGSRLIADNDEQLGSPAGSQRARHPGADLEMLLALPENSSCTAEQLGSLLAGRILDSQSPEHSAGEPTSRAVAGTSIALDARRGEIWITPVPASTDWAAPSCRFSLSDLLPTPPSAPSVAAVTQRDHSQGLSDPGSEMSQRFVLHSVPAPWKPGVAEMPQFHGAALIVGHGEPASALQRRLSDAGVVVRQLPIGDDLDATLAAFERIWNEQPLLHVFVTTARERHSNSPLDDASWGQRRHRMALAPYFICQRRGDSPARPDCWTAARWWPSRDSAVISAFPDRSPRLRALPKPA